MEPFQVSHHEHGRALIAKADSHSIELHTRLGELTLTETQLEWLTNVGGPAILHARRRARTLDVVRGEAGGTHAG